MGNTVIIPTYSCLIIFRRSSGVIPAFLSDNHTNVKTVTETCSGYRYLKDVRILCLSV